MAYLANLGTAIASLQATAQNSSDALAQTIDADSKLNWEEQKDELVRATTDYQEAAGATFSKNQKAKAAQHDEYLEGLTTDILNVSSTTMAAAILSDQALDAEMASKKEAHAQAWADLGDAEGDGDDFGKSFDEALDANVA